MRTTCLAASLRTSASAGSEYLLLVPAPGGSSDFLLAASATGVISAPKLEIKHKSSACTSVCVYVYCLLRSYIVCSMELCMLCQEMYTSAMYTYIYIHTVRVRYN